MLEKTRFHKKKIHGHIKKHFPKSVRKARKIFGFRYPKFFLLIFSVFLAYLIFRELNVSAWILRLDNLSYLGTFIAGFLYSFGFFTPFSVGFFIAAKPDSIILAALIGGVGSTIADLLIFKTIKSSFTDEFKKLEKNRIIKKIENIVKKNKSILIRHYLLYLFAGIIIATPLPDEVGVSMLAGLTTVNPKKLAAIGFAVHTIAIFLILKAF